MSLLRLVENILKRQPFTGFPMQKTIGKIIIFSFVTMACLMIAGASHAGPKPCYWGWWPNHWWNQDFQPYIDPAKEPHNGQPAKTACSCCMTGTPKNPSVATHATACSCSNSGCPLVRYACNLKPTGNGANVQYPLSFWHLCAHSKSSRKWRLADKESAWPLYRHV